MSKFENKENSVFFAAANSGKGFVSFYAEIFNSKDIARRYLIKGGPGTGKSTFMRRIATESEAKGSLVTYYHCSSDPSSLDGIIIDGKIAVIDSTAPHSVEPSLVGAKDTIVDLGVFWNCDALGAQIEKIDMLSAKKKRAYSLCYRFLSSAMQSDVASREMLLPYVDMLRVEKTARRLTQKIATGSGYSLKIGLKSAIGMSGQCDFDSYERIADKVVFIEEYYGLGFLVLSQICEFAIKNQNRICVSYLPLCPDVPDAVYFEDEKLAFIVCKSGKKEKKKSVSLRRALSLNNLSQKEKRKLRERAREAKKLSDALVLAACDELSLAGEAHFELETIYRSAMNFSALDAFVQDFIKRI